jgi:hypothetical protein
VGPTFPPRNISELARQQGKSRRTIKRLVAAGKLPAPQKIEKIDVKALFPVPQMTVPAATVPAEIPSQEERVPMGTPYVELVPAPTRGIDRWNAVGRGFVGLVLVGAGGVIACSSIAANIWFALSMTTDPLAAKTFATLSATSELVAVAMPTALSFYWDGRQWFRALLGAGVLAIALTVVALAASGFVVTNVSDATLIRVEHSHTVASAQAALDDAKAARDRECAKVGPVCRQREEIVNQRQAELDRAATTANAEADPQAAALHLTSNELRTVKAAVMVAICLAAGLIVALGSGLVFPRRRTV